MMAAVTSTPWAAITVHGIRTLAGRARRQRVAELKRDLAGNLLIYGCGELAYHLARHGLVDEIRFWLYPVVWGEGVRPFQAGRPPVRLSLISAVTLTSGLVLLSYRPDPPRDGA